MNKKNVLFIGEINRPIANANGICLESLADDLVKNNHRVTIASYRFNSAPVDETIQGVHYLRVKPTLFYRIRESSRAEEVSTLSQLKYKGSLLLNKIKKMLFIPLYPISSLGFIFRYYKFLKKAHKERSFDTIVSMYFPIDSLIVGYLLKRKFPKLEHSIYLIDTISNGAEVALLSSKWTRKRGIKWEHFFMKHADKTLVYKAHKEHYQSNEFASFQNKIEITDVPLFKPTLIDLDVVEEDKTLIYSGSLIPGLRSPEPMLALLSQEVFKDFKIDLYTQGGYDAEINEAKIITENRIQGHGYISHEEILERIGNTAMLISLGNSHSTMIPSKIFEYISTGKPIIHFYDNDADSSLVYFEKYDNCLIIDTRSDFNENTRLLIAFMKKIHIRTDMSALESMFEMNTPRYTNKLILDKRDSTHGTI